ncbi:MULTISPECIES: hypothetical protein [Acinetobacter]|uniref:hypothetical protein n=1 Tax=Acinetobacter TaxID=469 RepID=UPI0009425FD1|nr:MULTISPECIES: hypothetical protein [Acinetobacter]MCP0911326.1 hypothetical protein [Acinetobacter pseudolwoffii]MDM1323620.1 hypothetical protein [Acinetobacter pseudolwoffii]MDM1344281.1 hypothetical protein [Acinetobacter pseudolwoffii]
MYKSLCCIGILTLSTLTFADSDFEKELRTSCSKVKSYANNGKKFYDQKHYQQAIAQFKQQAAWSSFCEMNRDEAKTSFSEQAITTAFNNVGLSYSKLGKPQWARAWFSVYPDAKSSQFNLKQLPPPKKDTELAGTYVQHAGFGAWSTLKIVKQQQHYAIEYEGLYMGLRSLIYGPNLGGFNTTMPLNKTQAQYRSEDCKIDISLGFDAKLGSRAVLKQNSGDSGCGFGHNVSAAGVFLKVEN